MMKNHVLVTAICALGIFISSAPEPVTAQVHVLTRNDSAEIINRSEGLIKAFDNTLFFISSTSVELDIQQAIKLTFDSTAGTKQIFLNESSVIENDLKPENYKKKFKGDLDLPVGNYMNEFWKKFRDKQQQVAYFSSVICDNLHYAYSNDSLNPPDTTLYATVYFNCAFNVDDKNDWPFIKRKAEVRCKKNSSGKWDIRISEIVFNDEFNRDSAVVFFKKAVKEKRFDRGLIPDSIPLGFCSYKAPTDFSSTDSIQFSKLNADLVEAEQLYVAVDYYKALSKYHKINGIIKNDFVEKRTSNCNILKYTEAFKQEEHIEPFLNRYTKLRDRQELVMAKNVLDSALNIFPSNIRLKAHKLNLSRLLEDIQSLGRLRKKDPFSFKNEIDSRLHSSDSSIAYYYFIRAQYFESKDEIVNAINDLTKAISLETDFIEARKLRARLYLNPTIVFRDYALNDLEYLIKDNPNNDTLYAMAGECNALSDNFPDAITSFSQAISKNNKNPEYYYSRGMCHYQLKNWQSATVDFAEASRNRSKNPDNYYRLFEVYYYKLNKIDSSIVYLNAAKKSGLDCCAKELDSLSQYHLGKGIEQKNSTKDNMIAYSHFRWAANLNHKNHKAWYHYADLNVISLGKYPEAISAMDSALKYKPDTIPYLLLRGQAKTRNKNFESGKEDFDKVLGKNIATLPEKAEANEGIGDVMRALRKDIQAIAAYKSSIEYRKNYSPTYFKLAKLYEDNKQYEEAIDTYSQVTKISDIDSAYYKRGICYEELPERDYKSALKNFQRALQINPRYYLANYHAGICQKKNDNCTEALYYFDREINLKLHVPSYLEKADCEYSSLKFAEARIAFQSALQANKDTLKQNATLCKQYAYCCLADKYYPVAREYIDYGRKNYPNDKYFDYLLAEYSFLNGDVENAKIYFKEAFQLNGVTKEETKKDELFDRIKGENKEIKQLWKEYCK